MAPEFAASLVVLVATATVLDVRSGRIPNALVLSIAALGGVARMVGGWSPDALASSFGGLLVGLAVWIGPFALRWVGAGDVKLVAAVGVWLGPLATLRVSLYTGLAGGVLAIGYLLMRTRHPAAATVVALGAFRGSPRLASRGAEPGSAMGMPYTVAVLAGLIVELL